MRFGTAHRQMFRTHHACGALIRRMGGELMLEMLVAFALISITLVVVVGSFVTTQRANRSASAQAELSQALLFLLEDITREAWLSDHFDDTPPMSSGWCNGALYMKRVEGVNNQKADQVCYTLSGDGQIWKKIDMVSGSDTELPITPSGVDISDFSVTMSGDDAGNDAHPTKLLITLTATQEEDANMVAPLQLQTTITAHFVTQEGTP